MANNFKVWVEDDKLSNVLDDNAFSALVERQEGFQPGTAAIAKNMNTVLRQNSLFTTAFIQAIENKKTLTDDDISLSTSLETMISYFFKHITIDLGLRGYTAISNLDSQAVGLGSLAIGTGLVATEKVAFGLYNEDKNTNIFEIGLGTTATNRRNALALTKNGQLKLARAQAAANDDVATLRDVKDYKYMYKHIVTLRIRISFDNNNYDSYVLVDFIYYDYDSSNTTNINAFWELMKPQFAGSELKLIVNGRFEYTQASGITIKYPLSAFKFTDKTNYNYFNMSYIALDNGQITIVDSNWTANAIQVQYHSVVRID